MVMMISLFSGVFVQTADALGDAWVTLERFDQMKDFVNQGVTVSKPLNHPALSEYSWTNGGKTVKLSVGGQNVEYTFTHDECFAPGQVAYEGKTYNTITRSVTGPTATAFNAAAWLVYDTEGATEFSVTAFVAKTAEGIPADLTLEYRTSANGAWIKTDWFRAESMESDNNSNLSAGTGFVRRIYRGKLPGNAVQLKLTLPVPVKVMSSESMKAVQLAEVKFTGGGEQYQWSDGAALAQAEWTGEKAVLAWPEIQTADADVLYYLMQDNQLKAVLPKGTTTYQVQLEPGEEYKFDVYAAKLGDGTADITSPVLTLDNNIKGPGGAAEDFLDTFKFEKTMLADMDSHTGNFVHDASIPSLQRKNLTDDAHVVYGIPGLTDFRVTFRAWKDNKTSFTFEECKFYGSADGAEFFEIPAVNANPGIPGKYAEKLWIYSPAETIPAGTNYLKISFGKVSRLEYLSLKRVEASREQQSEEMILRDKIRRAMAWEILFPELDQNALTADLTLPETVQAEGKTYPVVWTASNAEIISPEGIISRGEQEQSVTLTAQVAYSGGTEPLIVEYPLQILRAGVDSMRVDPCESLSTLSARSEHVAQAALDDAKMDSVFMIEKVGNGTQFLDGSQYIEYDIENVSQFELRVGENDRGGDKIMKFETADESGVFLPLYNVNKVNRTAIPGANKGWYSASYISPEIPEGTKKIRMYFGAQKDGAYWAFGIDEIRFFIKNQSYTYQWPENAKAAVSGITKQGAELSWDAVTPLPAHEAVYDVYVNNVLQGTTAETNFSLQALERNTAYHVYIRARAADAPALVSKKLVADAFRTDRKRGVPEESEAKGNVVSPDTAEGEVISAKGMLRITDSSVLDNENYIMAGFENSQGERSNVYVKIYSTMAEYYKNGMLTIQLPHRQLKDGDVLWIDTEDYAVFGTAVRYTLDAGAAWESLYFCRTAGIDVFYEAAAERVYNQGETIYFDTNPMLESLPQNFTFEADVRLDPEAKENFVLQLFADSDYDAATPKMIASMWEMRNLTHGKDGALYMDYQISAVDSWNNGKTWGVNRAWMPRLEYDGNWRNLRLLVDFEQKTIQAAIDGRMVSEVPLSNINAAELAGMTVGADCALRNVKVTTGAHGFVYKPVAVVDEAGEPKPVLVPGETVNLRLEVLNTEDGIPIHAFIARGNQAAGQEVTQAEHLTEIPVSPGWQSLDVPVKVRDARERLCLYIWRDADNIQPVTAAGGYLGTPEEKGEDKRLFLIGDSTVYYVYDHERFGWGEVLQDYLTADMKVYNYAKDGTSTKTYLEYGRQNAMEPYMREGDYLLFQLGHNDRDNKYKGTTLEEYKDNLRKYVAMARQRGLHMIFVTPVTVMQDVGKTDLGSAQERTLYGFATAMKAVAEELDVPLIDLHQKSIRELGEEGVTGSADPNGIYYHDANGKIDATHFSEKGARVLCGYIKELLQDNPETQDIAKYFK